MRSVCLRQGDLATNGHTWQRGREFVHLTGLTIPVILLLLALAREHVNDNEHTASAINTHTVHRYSALQSTFSHSRSTHLFGICVRPISVLLYY